MEMQNVKAPYSWRVWMGCVCALALGLWFDVPVAAAATAFTMPTSAVDAQTVPDCSGVTAVPQTECNGLLRLYAETKGGQWDDSTNWGDMSAADAP